MHLPYWRNRLELQRFYFIDLLRLFIERRLCGYLPRFCCLGLLDGLFVEQRFCGELMLRGIARRFAWIRERYRTASGSWSLCHRFSIRRLMTAVDDGRCGRLGVAHRDLLLRWMSGLVVHVAGSC